MDIAMMSRAALHVLPRQVSPIRKYSDRERMNGLYADLTCSWCDLIEVSGGGEDDAVYNAYAEVLLGFFMIANEKKTTYKLLVPSDELENMKVKWKSSSFNAVCLIMQQQLLKSHFEHSVDAFVHAWHIVLKFGLTDLGLDEERIEASYDRMLKGTE